jgi:hypothetical protein
MSKWNSSEWKALCSGEACPICLSGKPFGIVAELNGTYLTSSPESPMRGYCCLVLKRHAVELYDLNADEACALMRDLPGRRGASGDHGGGQAKLRDPRQYDSSSACASVSPLQSGSVRGGADQTAAYQRVPVWRGRI